MSEHPEQVMWALQRASKPEGFMPNEASVASFLQSLEGRGWLHQLEQVPAWVITDKGRAELMRLLAEGQR